MGDSWEGGSVYCKACGEVYQPLRRNQRYCSSKCANREHNKRYLEKRVKETLKEAFEN